MLRFNLSKTNCTGCSACYSICPVHCITMVPDEEGFLYPIASNACIECKLCEIVCPLNNVKKNNNFPIKVYAAVSKDETIWRRSTSGGAFSEIVRHWGGEEDNETFIVGAAWIDFTVHHIGVIGFKNIAPLCKSKYVSSAIDDTFIEIRLQLQMGKKVIFCGTPCQVDGLIHYLRKPYENLLTIDLICHGVGSPKVFKECLNVVSNQLGEDVKSYEFRSKRKVIETDYLTKITTANNVYYVTNDPYHQLFLSQNILRPSCGKYCKYRKPERPGDITIADCKGLTEIFPDLRGCKKNWSTIICNSIKGINAIKNLDSTMEMREYSLDDVIKYNPLFARQTFFSKYRDQFFVNFSKHPYEAIIDNTKPFNIKKINIKTLLKTIIPACLLKLIIK